MREPDVGRAQSASGSRAPDQAMDHPMPVPTRQLPAKVIDLRFIAGLPSRPVPPIHAYDPHRRVPLRSMELGRIKCKTCGRHESDQIHLVIVSSADSG